MDSTLITVLSVAATGLVTKLLAVWERRQQRQVEVRNRAWDIEDRATKAAQVASALIEQAAGVAAALASQADRLAHTTSEQTARVIEKLDENTQLTAEARADANNAYAAGNDMSTKFLKIHSRLDRVDKRLDSLET